MDDHQPSPEEDEPEKPAKSHSKERHPDEKTDPNPETGDQPPEKSDLESTSESASESESDLESASESESDLESASESAGVEEQEGEPGEPATLNPNERHFDEKTDSNPEIGDQPPEMGEAESESVGVGAQGSETDGETPVGAEKPDRAIENEIPNSNERHPDEKTDPNPKTGDQPPEKGEAESESVGVEARGSETDGETPVGAEHDDFSAFSKQKAKGKYC